MISRQVTWLCVGLMILFASLAGGCNLQNKQTAANEKYPVKPITFIVSYAAGGSADMMARALEKVAQKHLGQSLVVTNITGGAGTIGWNELAGAKPDGYTIGYIGTGAVLQPLYGQTRYHYTTALEPLVQVMSTPSVAVVAADQPWEKMSDLVEYARRNPGVIKYGHSGLGSGNHVLGEMVAKEAGITINQVPFKGEAEALAAVLGGHIQLMFTSPPTVAEYVKSGKVKILAISSEQRLNDPVFQNVSTFKEQGLNVILYFRYGVGAPKGLPPEIKKQLADEFEKVVSDPEFKRNMEELGMTVEYLNFKDFNQKWAEDAENLAKMVKELKIAEKIAAQKQ